MPCRPVLVLGCLVALGAASSAPAQPPSTVERGRQLYAEGCIWCHGQDGRGATGTGPAEGPDGVQGAGPPLRGVGARSAHFYLSTGYMPLERPDEIPDRSPSPYSPADISALTAYVASLGGGPEVPRVDPREGDIGEGMRAFTEHCAGCHQVVAEGGVVLDGVAPELADATPTQIAEAIRVGPYLMPAFSEGDIDDRTVASIVRYVQYTKEPRDDGGWPIGHVGPIPEGFVAWIVAALGLVAVARIIGSALR